MSEDRHVSELDVVRILTFACVIAVHTISGTNVGSNPVSNGFEMLLHFTRESFFFLTGFVLMHQYGNRKYDLLRFYRRRILLVGAPYLAWTVIYTLWRPIVEHVGWGRQLHQLPFNVVFGTAWYHLYFLLVSLQIYLLFPVVSRLVRLTRQHHLTLLAVSGLVQLGLLALLAYGPEVPTWAADFQAHQDVYVWNYQFWILLGAVAASHRVGVTEWISRHRPAVVGFVVLGAVIALTWYCAAMVRGTSPVPAAAVLQPVMVPWSLAAIAGLFSIGTVWREHRRPGRWQAAIDYASDRSFGIFLVHPLILSGFLAADDRVVARHLGNPGLTILSYLIVVAGAVAATELLRRSRISLLLTGRPQVHHRVQPTADRRLEPGSPTESVSQSDKEQFDARNQPAAT